jgi:hypothetical protein
VRSGLGAATGSAVGTGSTACQCGTADDGSGGRDAGSGS